MLLIPLEHPLHGRMHIYSIHDLTAHLMAGWHVIEDDEINKDLNYMAAKNFIILQGKNEVKTNEKRLQANEKRHAVQAKKEKITGAVATNLKDQLTGVPCNDDRD